MAAFGQPSPFGQSGMGFGQSAFGASSSGQSSFGGAPAFGQQQGAPGMSAFGAQASAPQTPSFGMPGRFGQSSSSMFGQAAPSMFGQSSASMFGAPAAGGLGQSAPSMFGQSSSGMFGQTAPSMFGQSSGGMSGGGMFGAAPGGSSPFKAGAFGQSSGGMFGQSSGGMFGQSSGGMFGQSSGGMFGQSKSMFGQSSSSAFGSMSVPSMTSSSFGSYGTMGSSPFGGSTAGMSSSMFGGSSGSGFGSWNASPVGSGFSLMTSVAPSAAFQQGLPQGIMGVLSSLQASYHPQSPNCRFRYMVYNRGPEGNPVALEQLQRTPDTQLNLDNQPLPVNKNLWEQAMLKNPDRSRLYPFQLTGFEDLSNRLKQQEQSIKRHEKELQDLESKQTALMHRLQTHTMTKLDESRHRHTQLAQRLIELMDKVEQVAGSRGRLQRNVVDEINMHRKLQTKLYEVEQLKTRLNELVAAVTSVTSNGAMDGAGETLSEQELAKLHHVLSQQTAGLDALTSVLKKDLKDVRIMERGLNQITDGSS